VFASQSALDGGATKSPLPAGEGWVRGPTECQPNPLGFRRRGLKFVGSAF